MTRPWKKSNNSDAAEAVAGPAVQSTHVEAAMPTVAVGAGPRVPVAGNPETPSPTMKELFPDQDSKYGLRAIHTPSFHQVDIVFLHGLTGSADKTFLLDETGIYWPVHLLTHDIPSARILTFGYDADVTHFMGAVGKHTIEDHATSLVNGLARVKRVSPSVSRRAFPTTCLNILTSFGV